MRQAIGVALVLAVGLLGASRAEAQTACGYGGTCVVTVTVGGAPSAELGRPAPQLAVPRLAEPSDELSSYTRPRWGLVITGLSLFVGGYAFGVALDDSMGNIGTGAVPLVGPFVAMTEGTQVFLLPLFAVAGALQIAGAVLAIVGVAAQQRIERPAQESFAIAPWASQDGAGATATGVF